MDSGGPIASLRQHNCSVSENVERVGLKSQTSPHWRTLHEKAGGQASDVPIEKFPVRPSDVLPLPFAFCGLLYSALHLSYSKNNNLQDAGIPPPTPYLLQPVRVPVHVAVYVSSLPRCQVGVINSVPRRLSPSGQMMAFRSQIFTGSSYFPPLWLFLVLLPLSSLKRRV